MSRKKTGPPQGDPQVDPALPGQLTLLEPASPSSEAVVSCPTPPVEPSADAHQAPQLKERTRSVKQPGQKTLQDILWSETLQAIRLSTTCSSVLDLVHRLRDELPQNSPISRERHTATVLSRFFPGIEIRTLPTRVAAECSEETLAAVVAPLLLIAEPVLGLLFAERLHPIPAGSNLPPDFFVRFANEAVAADVKHVAGRCANAARSLGWTSRVQRKTSRIQAPVNFWAAVLVFHHVYAPTPGIVDVSRVLAEPIWKYLAFSDPDAVRSWLRDLERQGLIARYSRVDRLEQVTTRHDLDTLIQKAAAGPGRRGPRQ